MISARRFAAVLILLLVAVGGSSTSPTLAGTDQPAGKNCVGEEGSEQGPDAEEAQADSEAEEDEGSPPKFSSAFYKRTFTLDTSMDGIQGREIPISIEEVCDVPKARAKEAAQLVGGDGVALLRPGTRVRLDGKTVQGKAATTALDGADTAVFTVRLARPRYWREDEEGNPTPTFTARRIEITD